MTTPFFSKKQIMPLVEKYGIDTTSEDFCKLIQVFDGQTNYQIWAIKAFYEKALTMENLEVIAYFIKEHQPLIRTLSRTNVVLYKTKEEIAQLLQEIDGAMLIFHAKEAINSFNTDQKHMLNNFLFSELLDENPAPLKAISNADFRKYATLLARMIRLHPTLQDNLFQTLSAVRNVNELFRYIEDAFKNSYSWDKEGLFEFIKRDSRCQGVKVFYNKGSVVILEIPNFEAAKALAFARTSWCLSRESHHFNSYVTNRHGRQFFYFNFAKQEQCEIAHVGFTVLPNGQISAAHSTSNTSLVDNSVFVGGKAYNIHKVLEEIHLDRSAFIKLNPLVYFEWNMNSVLHLIQTESRHLEKIFSDDKFVFVRIIDSLGYTKLMSHTLISSSEWNSNDTFYALLDMSKDVNAEYSTVYVRCIKDVYGTLSVSRSMNGYNTLLQADYFDRIHFPINTFIVNQSIRPEILLHKYINEGHEDAAVGLVAENPDMDVNYVFHETLPIFAAISNRMPNLFTKLFDHQNMNIKALDILEEPIFQSLIYTYRQDLYLNDGDETDSAKKVRQMIDHVLDCDTYDFNLINYNEDSPIMVAVEQANTNWIVEKLIAKANIDLKLKNDVGRTALGNAIFFRNTDGIKLLLSREDCPIDEEAKKLAANGSYDLDKMKEEATRINANNASDYMTAFANLFQNLGK